jgi:hypothetical protein
MNDSTRVMRRPPRAWPRPARAAGAIIATAALALLAAACSGGPSSTDGSPGAGGPAGTPSAVAYSACMHSQGVPNYPDPEPPSQTHEGHELRSVTTRPVRVSVHCAVRLLCATFVAAGAQGELSTATAGPAAASRRGNISLPYLSSL